MPRRRATRRLSAPLALSTLALSTVAVSAAMLGQPPAAADRGDAGQLGRPNILMITADDATVSDLAYMPHVRDLVADRGVTFTGAVAPTPICVPARASLLTGQYAHNHGAHTISGPHGGFDSLPDASTLPVWLSRAGYDTLFVGKYLNGYGDQPADRRYVPPGWDQWRAGVGGSTYNYLHPTLNVNGRLVRNDRYSTTLFRDHVNTLLEKRRRTRKPWFLWVNYVAPHDGGPAESDDPQVTDPENPRAMKTAHPAARYRDTMSQVPLPDLPNMFSVNDGTQSRASTPELAGWDQASRGLMQEAYQQRLESLRSVDDAVASAVRRLKRTGQYRDTVILFTSDNGYLVGQHSRVGKLLPFRSSLSIPVLMAGPGIPRGVRERTVVTNPDLAVTIADLAGARPGRRVDGRSVLDFLRRRPVHRVIPIEAWKVHDGSRLKYTGVHTGRYTYAVYADDQVPELYDHRTDPYELHNLAAGGHNRLVARMESLRRRYIDCSGDGCE